MKRFFLLVFLSIASLQVYAAHPVRHVDKVVIWGHKLHSHTHSYIHYAFERAFRHLGYQTYWLDKTDDISHLDLSNALFITEGRVDGGIPLRDDAFYIIHNCNAEKYLPYLKKKSAIILQVYTHDCIARNDARISYGFHYDLEKQTLYMPWATDLLPHEIDEQKEKVATIAKNKTIAHFNGTILANTPYANRQQLLAFQKACQENGISFVTRGASSSSPEQTIHAIQSAYLAPALQGKWQCEHGYIPCRIFKNISYGALGMTNSEAVYQLFDKKIVYNPDSYQLCNDALSRLKTWSLQDQYDLMDLVKEKHTYLNRIESLFSFFEMIAQNDPSYFS